MAKARRGKAKAPRKPVKSRAKKKKPAKRAAAKAPARPVAASRTARAPAPPPRKSLARRGAVTAARTATRIAPGGSRNPYDTDLDKNPANFQALTPITFLERAAKVYPERTAIVHGKSRFTYAQWYE